MEHNLFKIYGNQEWVWQCMREAAYFMMVFGMTRPGHEPMTYHIRCGHANH